MVRFSGYIQKLDSPYYKQGINVNKIAGENDILLEGDIEPEGEKISTFVVFNFGIVLL